MSSAGATIRHLVITAAFLRAVATSMVAILLGIHLARVGLSPASIGVVVSAGLWGAAVGALVATLRGDRIGRRRLLVTVAILGAAGTAAVAFASDRTILVVSSFLGMVNGMGRDRGAALILEQAILPSTVADRGRTMSFAWYNVLQDAGSGLGALLAGTPAVLRHLGARELASFRLSLVLGSLLLASTAVLYAWLPRTAEIAAVARRPSVSSETRPILLKVTGLFALDSLGGGFLRGAHLALLL